MAASQIPGFETPASDRDWYSCVLGGVILPGIVTINGLKVGIDCDTKKAKGSDQPTSTDNGLEPAKFEIRVWMNSQHYADWQIALPHFNPRRPGRERSPLQIIHPQTSELGINQIRVLSIESEQPSGAKGFVRIIKCQEWFDKPKPVKKPQVRPEDARPYPHVSEAIALGGGQLGTVGAWGMGVRPNMPTNEEVDPNTLKSLDPSSEENLKKSIFDSSFSGN